MSWPNHAGGVLPPALTFSSGHASRRRGLFEQGQRAWPLCPSGFKEAAAQADDGSHTHPSHWRGYGRARESCARHRPGAGRRRLPTALRRRPRPGRVEGGAARGDSDPVRARVGLSRHASVARSCRFPRQPLGRHPPGASPSSLSFRPDVIVGTGGFASAPVMFAAALLRKLRLSHARVYVHEQNAAPGKLNQVVGRLADRVFVTFPETLSSFPANGVVTRLPAAQADRGREPRRRRPPALDFTIPPGRQVVFAFGGSQGARTINRAVVDALARPAARTATGSSSSTARGCSRAARTTPKRDTRARLDARYTEEERRLIDAFYVARPFFYQIENVYAVADLVVARAGAGTLYELASLGLPAIVVPKANLPGDHQVMNARAMARCGGATVLYEETTLAGERIIEELDGGRLAFQIVSLLTDADAALRHARARAHVRAAGCAGDHRAEHQAEDGRRQAGCEPAERRTPTELAPRGAAGAPAAARRCRRCPATTPCSRSSSGRRRARARRFCPEEVVPSPTTAPTSSAGRHRCWPAPRGSSATWASSSWACCTRATSCRCCWRCSTTSGRRRGTSDCSAATTCRWASSGATSSPRSAGSAS